MYQILTLYALNLHHVSCQLSLNKARKTNKKELLYNDHPMKLLLQMVSQIPFLEPNGWKLVNTKRKEKSDSSHSALLLFMERHTKASCVTVVLFHCFQVLKTFAEEPLR